MTRTNQTVGISSSVVNHRIPYAPSRMEATAHRAFDDLLRSYSPFGQLRTLLTLPRPGIGIGGYSGSAEPFSLDHVIARTLGLSGFSAGLDRQVYGGGKGLQLFDMVASTAGEAVERMLGSFAFLDAIDSPDCWQGTYDELTAAGEVCIGPEDMQLFHPVQYEQPGFLFEPWKTDTPLQWLAGENGLNGQRTWVPAQLVHMFHVMDPRETRIGFSSSGGLSTHVDESSAKYHAVLELVERDAINLRWFCRIPPPRIELDRAFDDPRLRRWFEEAERAGMPIELYSHSLDFEGDVVVVTALSWDRELPQASYFAGGGVGLSAEEAIVGAVTELVQAERMIRVPTMAPTWDVSSGINRLFGSPEDLKPEDFNNFIQVIPYYGHAKNRERLDWYFAPDNQPAVALSELPDRRVRSGEEGWQVVSDMAKRHGLTPIVYDWTPDMFDTIRLVKVIIPELAPAFPPNMLSLGHRRYRELPRELGYREDEMPFEEFTTDPLPYP